MVGGSRAVPGPDARSDGHDTADGVYPALNDVLAGDYFVVIFAALASLAALKVVICQYRLWQLQQRRVSDEEGGRFSDFLHHAHWIKDALNPV
ncbi:hypothetical protein EAO03_30265 [Klebsiella pneumoniae]|nr:hypothetical protein EAO03_30265 [Klebsiella pneumoniae]